MTIEDLLRDEEGHRLTVYLDSLGKPTVGTGHLVIPSDNLKVGDTITEARAEQLFQVDLAKAELSIASGLADFEDLNEVRQAVLISMTFQLGWHGLSAFRNTLALIATHRYADAAVEMLESLWAKQTPNRAKQLSEMMKTGLWPKET